MKADPGSSELLDRSYGYMKRNDPDFVRMAPNYSTLRPFNRDSSMIVQTESETKGQNPPPAGQAEFLHLRILKPMDVRLIVADSLGNGLISYEFFTLTEGSYTIGSKGWPLPQEELTKGGRWAYVYLVGDQRFRSRYRFLVDEKQHFNYMEPPPPIG